jgi:drug/metabolite transporter (DMT)-like permease
MKDQNKAYIYALSAVLLWSTVASSFKISLRYLDFLQLLLLAAIASVAILFLVVVYQKKLNLLKHSSLRDYSRAALLGFLNPFLYYVILFKAYSLLPAQEAQPLNYTWAIMLVILSVPLLKQKIGLKSIVAILISFFGVLVISTQGNIFDFRFTNLFGASLAVGSSVIWALFWIYNAKDKRDEVVKLFMSFTFGLIYISIATLIFSDVYIDDVKGLVGAIYVGFFEMGITFVLWSKAIALSKTTAMVSRFIFLSPFISLVLIHLLVGEDILPSSIIGLALIIAGIALEQFKLGKK